jgi:hypothetical protein
MIPRPLPYGPNTSSLADRKILWKMSSIPDGLEANPGIQVKAVTPQTINKDMKIIIQLKE